MRVRLGKRANEKAIQAKKNWIEEVNNVIYVAFCIAVALIRKAIGTKKFDWKSSFFFFASSSYFLYFLVFFLFIHFSSLLPFVHHFYIVHCAPLFLFSSFMFFFLLRILFSFWLWLLYRICYWCCWLQNLRCVCPAKNNKRSNGKQRNESAWNKVEPKKQKKWGKK